MPNEQAERYKAQGNTALAGGMTEEAVRLYTLAIREDPFSEVYFSNRSAAYATLARFKEALEDADEVVRLKPAWVKGHTRRGAALSGLKKHEEARKAYLKACEFDPANTQARELMEAEAAAAAAAAAQSKEWENDLWSDEEEEAPAPAPSAPGGGGAKRSAPGGGGGGASEDNGSRKKRRAPGKLMAKLSTSLADASAVTLRVCLQQLCAADEHLAERTLQAGHRATRPTPRAPASPWPSPPCCCTRPVALWPRVSALAAAVLTICSPWPRVPWRCRCSRGSTRTRATERTATASTRTGARATRAAAEAGVARARRGRSHRPWGREGAARARWLAATQRTRTKQS